MTADEARSVVPASRWDPLVTRLRDLRRTAGDPSFGRIAELVVEHRVRAGAAPAAAHLARSTVYDLFRLGRPRVNLDLVREVARALGADDLVTERWISECRASGAAPADEEDQVPRKGEVALVMLGCLVLNLLGREFVDFFNLPVYLDMTGTAIAAIVLGPWRGAALGAATNVLGAFGSGLISVPFALVNVAGALVWGYGVRRWGMGRSLARYFALSVVVALVCTVVAVPIIVVSLHHDLRVGNDVVTQLVSDSVNTFVLAVGLSNILTSAADKLLSGFFALVVATALPWRLRRGIPLVLVEQRS